MSQIIAAQIEHDDKEDYLFVLDTMGRVWQGYWAGTQKWVWSRVELPDDTQ